MTTQGPKYYVNVEGVEHSWPSPTITFEEIANLGGWPPGDGVIEIDAENNERQLAPGEVVELKPGQGFAKKIRWQRGDHPIEARLDQELILLQGRFGAVVRQGEWFLVPEYAIHGPGWSYERMPVSFRAQVGYPGANPYGFYVPADLKCSGATPQSFQAAPADRPPFEGTWGMFSWAPQDAWRPGATPQSGANLFNFALSFAERFRSGA